MVLEEQEGQQHQECIGQFGTTGRPTQGGSHHMICCVGERNLQDGTFD